MPPVTYILNWSRNADGSQSSTTLNGKTYRVDYVDEEWWAMTPYGGRSPHASVGEAKVAAELRAADEQGDDNLKL